MKKYKVTAKISGMKFKVVIKASDLIDAMHEFILGYDYSEVSYTQITNIKIKEK